MKTLAWMWVVLVVSGLSVAAVLYQPVAIALAVTAFCVITGLAIGYLIVG